MEAATAIRDHHDKRVSQDRDRLVYITDRMNYFHVKYREETDNRIKLLEEQILQLTRVNPMQAQANSQPQPESTQKSKTQPKQLLLSYSDVLQYRANGGKPSTPPTATSIHISCTDVTNNIDEEIAKAKIVSTGVIRVREASNGTKRIITTTSAETANAIAQQLDKQRLKVETVPAKSRLPIVEFEAPKEIPSPTIDTAMGQGSTKLWSRSIKNGAATRYAYTIQPAKFREISATNSIFLNNRVIHVAESRSVTRCCHCQELGHSSRHCDKKSQAPVCSRCAQSHKTADCNSNLPNTELACINCKRAKLPHQGHGAFSEDCPCMKRAVHNRLLRTDYGF